MRKFLVLCFGLAVLAGPACAAGPTVQLPHYDCTSAQAGNQPVRRLGQVIGGVYYEWREYLARGANGKPDPTAAPICLQQLSPTTGFLSRAQAEAFLASSLPVPTTPGPQTQSNGLDSAAKAPAMPMPHAKTPPKAKEQSGGAVSAPATIANDNRQMVGDTTAFPYSNVVYLVAQFPSGNAFRCSGILATPYVVMTAGHCIHNNKEQGYANVVTIIPGQSQSGSAPLRPFGTQTAIGVATTVEWQTLSGPDDQLVTDYRHDIATVRLAAPFAGINSFMPVVYDNPAATAFSAGYPAQVASSSATNYAQWTAQGAQDSDSINNDYHAMGLAEYQVAVSGGNSGGPYWISDVLGRQLLVGITSYGDDSTGESGGPYYSNFNQTQVANWLTWTPSHPVADPVRTANLTFAAAISLSGESGQVQGSNAGAVAEAGGPIAANSGGGRIAWWQWTAPRDGFVTIDTLGSNFDTVLGVYTGAAVNALTTIAADDDIQDGVIQASRVQFPVKAGAVYSIGVDGFNAPPPDNDGGDMGKIVLNWTMTPPAYAFAAIPLSGESGQNYATNAANATSWFLWQAPRTGYVQIGTGGSAFPAQVNAYTGTALGTLFSIGAATGQGQTTFLANAGTNYLIGVSGNGTVPANVDLNWAMTAQICPDTGWWYQSALPGAGFAVEANSDPINGGGRLFFAAYEYDATGRPIWYAGTLSPGISAANYAGTLNAYVLNTAGALQTTALGPFQINVASGAAMTMIWPPAGPVMPAASGGQSVSLTRYPLNGQTVIQPGSTVAMQNGWWFNPSQPGRGWMIEVQGSTLYLGYFGYRADGTPAWYVASGPTDGTHFSGGLIETQGGPFFTQPTAAALTTTPIGTIAVVFTAPNQAVVTLPDGSNQTIQRFSAF